MCVDLTHAEIMMTITCKGDEAIEPDVTGGVSVPDIVWTYAAHDGNDAGV